jgi:amidophosphoribosyltransferase
VNLKLSPVRSEIAGKRICLVDDSIVRGTTSRKLIELVRRAGAKEVYFVSTCPPIRHPCYYGIDFPSGKELIAHEKDLAAIEKELGADALIYLDLPGLKSALVSARQGHEGSSGTEFSPCMACLDGKYPTDVSDGKRFGEMRGEMRGQPGGPKGDKGGGSK